MTEQGYKYVGFWARVLASIVDSILILMISVPILHAVYGSQYWYDTSLVQGPIDFLVTWVLPAVAIIAFWVARQATPGKMLISAKIVDAKTGGKPSTGQLIGRYFAYFVSTIPLLLGFVWVGIDKRKQGWHDKLADTLVVSTKAPEVQSARD